MSRYWGNGLDPATEGRTLLGVELSEDRQHLTLRFADGEDRYRADGDCCSSTWVEHLTVPDLGDGALVTGIKDSNWNSTPATPEQYEESRKHQEWLGVLVVYQSAIVTTKGEVIIEYRNDSNGYYGGWLEKVASA